MNGHTLSSLISGFFVLSGFFAALLLFYYTRKHRPDMKIMQAVWPLTGLWAGWLSIWGYKRLSKKDTMEMSSGGMMDMDMPMPMRPMWQKTALSTLHCGAGCTLADITGEWFTFFVPLHIGGSQIAAQWTIDFILALAIGIFFQYAAIRPMEHLSIRQTISKAFKIDFLSLTSWQIGMYCWMAIVIFGIGGGTPLPKNDWTFWFMMQVAMGFGFITAYPVNWLLIKKGIKQGM